MFELRSVPLECKCKQKISTIFFKTHRNTNKYSDKKKTKNYFQRIECVNKNIFFAMKIL